MSRVICGYASLFGVADLAGDEIAKGAFAQSLGRHKKPLAMLYQHDTTRPIGHWTQMRETPRGLWVEGELAQGVQLAEEVKALIGQNMLQGLSIGFRAVRARAGRGKIKRRLLEIELVEISIVTFPMQPQATLYGVPTDGKSAVDLSMTQAGCRLRHMTQS